MFVAMLILSFCRLCVAAFSHPGVMENAEDSMNEENAWSVLIKSWCF